MPAKNTLLALHIVVLMSCLGVALLEGSRSAPVPVIPAVVASLSETEEQLPKEMTVENFTVLNLDIGEQDPVRLNAEAQQELSLFKQFHPSLEVLRAEWLTEHSLLVHHRPAATNSPTPLTGLGSVQ